MVKKSLDKTETLSIPRSHTKQRILSGDIDNHFRPGDILLDDYVIESVLGKGGMGVVYLVKRMNWDTVFAVKTLRSTSVNNINQKRKLLRELRTWMDLPPHPNLASCNFFKTVGDRLFIFAQYIDGGTLSDWICSDAPRTLSEILDIMIQLAWGLYAAHCNGVIHQDVKPSNVLMTRDGLIKLTDFGLASVSASSPIPDESPDEANSHLVTSNGMTPAYSSPEQMNRQKLSHKTDIWSYGMSVMEMFSGGVNWNVGAAGPMILDALLKKMKNDSGPIMPQSIQQVLQRCFERDPHARWNNMLDIAAELQRIYRVETGIDYPRIQPEFIELPIRNQLDRQSITGHMWDDPMVWLKKALKIAGNHQEVLDLAVPTRKGSRRVQAIVDLEVFDMAERIFLDLIAGGQNDLEIQLAQLYFQKSFVNEYLDDNVNAMVLMNKMVDIYEKIVAENRSKETVQHLFDAYSRIGSHLHHVGKFQESLTVVDKAIALLSSSNIQELGWLSRVDQAMIYENKGFLSLEMGLLDQASACCQTAITLSKQALNDQFDPKAMFYLGKSHTTLAGILSGKEDASGALTYLNQGIEILEELTHRGKHPQAEMNIIYNLLNKSMLLDNLEDHQKSLETLEHCEQRINKLIRDEDRIEMRYFLATLTMKKGITCYQMKNTPLALEFLDESIDMFNTLIDSQGKPELSRDLFFAFSRKAEILQELGDKNQTLELLNQVLTILDHYTETYQLVDFGVERANTLVKRALLKVSMGDTDGIDVDLRAAIPILESAKETQAEYQQNLDAAKAILETL